MKLSYIVPVYKVEQYLNECVESILAQTMDDYEIILVDDGSPDNCPAMCDAYQEKYPDTIRVIHKENEGPAVARNVGIEAARGDYLYFIDSDDFFFDDRIRELYDKAVEFDADILQSSYMSFFENSTERKKIVSPFETERIYSHEAMEKELCYASSKRLIVFMWRNLYKREFVIKNNLRLDTKLRMVEDPPFNMEAFAKAERFVAVDIPVLCYRKRDNSLQRQKYVPDYDKWMCLQWELKLKYYSENCTPSQVFYEDIGEYTVKSIFPMLLENVYRNKPEEAFAVLKRLGNSEMMRRSFKDYDINKFRSRSLDWLMTWCAKKKFYLFAHIICKYILYK